ncbi:MAG: hypothetical protein KDD19_15750 [Phaeodactylibacter sp.]|nr:hypothetical protein [Phaeodactylibacter sp.]MCB9050916.1 hypothetical protein [Lewinellaceae bacterium]
MLKLLLAQTTPSGSERVAKYFLDFADAVGADVTVQKPDTCKAKPQFLNLTARWPWLQCFIGPDAVREVETASRLFPYDLILAGRENKNIRWWKADANALAATAWAPVMLLPMNPIFKPFRNILFIDNHLFRCSQPVLGKLGEQWRQKRYLFPLRHRLFKGGSYLHGRFDESGYPVFPILNGVRLNQFIERHQIGLVVASHHNAKENVRILEKLPVPTLVFNSRNRVDPKSESRRPAAFTAAITSWIG